MPDDTGIFKAKRTPFGGLSLSTKKSRAKNKRERQNRKKGRR